MSNTPIIDEVIQQLRDKGLEVEQKHDLFQDDNRIVYTKWYKNKLRKSKRNLLNNLPK